MDLNVNSGPKYVNKWFYCLISLIGFGLASIISTNIKVIDYFNLNQNIINLLFNDGYFSHTREYDFDLMDDYSDCEQRHLGWQNKHILGDLSFNSSKKIVICHNDDHQDNLQYANIECYQILNRRLGTRGPAHICIINNVYGYKSKDGKLKFKAYCKHKLNITQKEIIVNLKKSYNSTDSELMQYPLYLDIVDDEYPRYKSDDILNSMNKDIWFYDNSHQCSKHKKNEKNEIGNPWHCFAHLESWYHIKHALNLSMSEYNITLIMSQFDNNQFGTHSAMYHFWTPFFESIVNKEDIRNLPDGKFYIKQMILDERSAKDWGFPMLWKGYMLEKYDRDKRCQNDSELHRSPILMEMKKEMIRYYDSAPFYSHYEWIAEIKKMTEDAENLNRWEISGVLHDNDNERGLSKIIFVGTRWINGICRRRCIDNMHDLYLKIVELFNDLNDGYEYVVILGNAGTISFRAQYHLFRNTDIFIGVHGAVFVMAGVFMNTDGLRYEISLPSKRNTTFGLQTSDSVIIMFGGFKNYVRFACKDCVQSEKIDKLANDIDIDACSMDILQAYKTRVYH